MVAHSFLAHSVTSSTSKHHTQCSLASDSVLSCVFPASVFVNFCLLLFYSWCKILPTYSILWLPFCLPIHLIPHNSLMRRGSGRLPVGDHLSHPWSTGLGEVSGATFTYCALLSLSRFFSLSHLSKLREKNETTLWKTKLWIFLWRFALLSVRQSRVPSRKGCLFFFLLNNLFSFSFV